MRTIAIISFICLFIVMTVRGQEDCCPNTAIYGDDQNNEYSIIKHFDGSNFLIGYSKINGDYQPTFTKFDEKFNIQFQITFNYEGIFYDFEKADDGGFFLVGRTTSSNSKSVLTKVSSTGDVIFTRFYDLSVRESFLKIVKHTNPVDQAYPFYLSAAASPDMGSLTTEYVYLFNMNNNGDMKWTRRYNYTNIDQFASSLVPLQDGGLVMLGNALPMTAIAVRLDPFGSPIFASRTDGFRFLDGVEVATGKIAVAGYKDESKDLAMLFSLNDQMSVLSGTNLGAEFETFYHIKKDSDGNIYVPGAYETDQSVIIKCAFSNNDITVQQSKYFDYGESRFYEPSLDVKGDKLYVADIRKKNPEAYGKKDVVLGAFSTKLDEECLKDFSVNALFPNIISQSINSVTVTEENIPAPSENIDYTALTFEAKPICVVDEDCNNGIDDDGDGLIDYLDPDCQCEQGNVIEHVPNSGFEEHTDCCITINDGCVNDWMVIGGSPDYISEECLSDVNFEEYETLFKLEIINSAIHIGGNNNLMESFGTCLSETLSAGKQYKLSLDMVAKDIFDPTDETPITGKINLYGWKDCNSFKTYAALNNYCFDKNVNTDAELLYSIDLSALTLSKWESVKSSINPTNNIEAISIEVDCVDNPITSVSPFFLMDNISIKGGAWEYEDTIVVKEDLCDESFYLAVKDSADLKYQWYKDGSPIQDADSSAYFFNKENETTGGLFQVVIFNSDSCYVVEEYQLELLESKKTELNELICPGDSIYFGGVWRFNAGFYTDKLTAANGCDSTVTLNVGFDTSPDCTTEEDCTNGVDDDGDGLVDYLDPDCQCEPSNIIEHVPNSGFEENTDCCLLLSDGCVNNWIDIAGSVDYLNPECVGESVWKSYETEFGVPISSSVFRVGASPSAIESFGTCLNQPLSENQSYDISLKTVRIEPFDPTGLNPVEGFIHVFGWKTCEAFNDHASSNATCVDPSTNSEVVDLFKIDLNGFKQFEWKTFQSAISLTDNIKAISIEYSCLDGGIELDENSFIVFLMDYVSIKRQGVVQVPDYDIELEGNLCDDSFSLVTKDSSNYSYQWYKEGELFEGSNSSSFKFDKNAGHKDGLYQVAIITPEGCSIVDSIDVKTGQHVSVEITESICSGDSLYFEGEWLDKAGDYSVVIQTAEGCDSTRMLKLEIGEDILKEQDFSICMNESITIGDSVLTKAGQYQISVSGENSCDTLYTVNLSVFPNTGIKEFPQICNGDTYTYKNEEFNTSGTYYVDYQNVHGCMATDTIVLTVNPTYDHNEPITLCPGDTFFYKGTIALFKEDLYIFNEQTVNGCDSIVNIPLTLYEEPTVTENVTICQGQTYNYNGIEYSEKGDYSFTYVSQNGCDSTYTISLDVVDTIKSFELKYICEGESYMIDGEELTASGLYTYYYKSQAGCDSLFVLELGILAPSATNEQIEICENQYHLQENDTLRTEGQYEYKYTSFTGCDSLHTINLVVHDNVEGTTMEVEIEEGEYFVFGEDTLKQEGKYSHIYTSASGCDSIEYLELRIKKIKNDIFIPNVFSPNNDGVNDRFNIYASSEVGMDILELSIFDRWGNRVFKEVNIGKNWIGWDGKFNGSKVIAGVYVFTLKYKDAKDRVHLRSGNMTIIY